MPEYDYDYDSATRAGLGPDSTGHWPSVAPLTDEKAEQLGLPPESGLILKSREHPTFHKTIAGEDAVGRKIVRVGDRDYSVLKGVGKKRMPQFDEVKLDRDIDFLVNEGFTDAEIDDYLEHNIKNYSSVPENGKGGGGLFAPRKVKALGKIPRKMGLGDFPVYERAAKKAVATFAGTYAPEFLGRLVELGEGTEGREAYLKNMTDIKGVYEKELAENPAEGGLEHFAEAAGSVAGVMPDFVGMGKIMAPVKSLQALPFLKKYPKFAKFFAESQHAGATFAGVESKHGPEAALQGYLAGQAFHIAGLPKSKAVKAVTLGLTGKWTAMLQGATPDQSNAQGLLFMALALTSIGRVRPREYKKAKAEFLKIAEETGVSKENASAVAGEVGVVSRGMLPKNVADYLLEMHTESKFRRTIDEVHQEIAKGGPKEETQNFADFMDGINKLEEPFKPERIIPGEEYSGPRRPETGSEGLRTSREVVSEPLEAPKVTTEEARARVEKTFGRPEHPASIKRPETIEAGILAGMEARELSDTRAKRSMAKFDAHLEKGEVSGAQVELSEVKNYVNRNPQDMDMVAVEAKMIERFKQEDAGTVVEDAGNKFLRDQNKTEYLKQRRRIGHLQSELGWDKNTVKYQEYLKETFGVNSSKLLTGDQINKVVKDLRAMTGDSKGKGSTVRPESGKVTKGVEIITPEQEQSINTRTASLRKRGMTDSDLSYVYEEAGLKPDHKVGFQDTKNFTSKSQASKLARELHLFEETLAPVRERELHASQDPQIVKAYSKVKRTMDSLRGGKAPSQLLSMRFYVGKVEELSGGRLPFLSIYENIIFKRNIVQKTINNHYKRLSKANGETGADALADIMADPKADKRISDYIASKSKHKGKPSPPKDITQAEVNVANEMMKILEDYKWRYRAWKFYEWKFQDKKIAGFERYKEQIMTADRAYESGGQEALFTILKAQDWGVLERGCEPHDLLFNRGLRTVKRRKGKGGSPGERVYEYQEQDAPRF